MGKEAGNIKDIAIMVEGGEYGRSYEYYIDVYMDYYPLKQRIFLME